LLDGLPDGVLGYERTHHDDRRLVLISFLDTPAAVSLDGGWSTQLTSDGISFDGILAPSQAVLLRG
jgi:hypothetical protein